MRSPARPPRPRTALLAAAIGLAAGAARGEENERVRLTWSAPEGCPGGAAVLAEVDRLLGPKARPAARIEAAASVARDDKGGYRVRLETQGEGAPRTREVRGATCQAIADATALILALMIDPDAAVNAPPPAAASPSSPPPAPADAPPSPSNAAPAPAPTTPPSPPPAPSIAMAPPVIAMAPPRVAPPPPNPLSFRLLAWAGADLGSLPGLSAGFGADAALVYSRQRVAAGFAIRPAREATVATRSSAGGDVDLVAGHLVTCRDFLGGRFELGPCVGVELGRLHAVGFGVRTPGEASEVWAAARAGGMFSWEPTPRLGLLLRLDAAFPFRRPRFVLEEVGPVHRPAAVIGRVEGGIELRF